MRRWLIWPSVAMAAAAVMVAASRGLGVSAVDHRPLPLEATVARRAWRHLVPARVRDMANPAPTSPADLKGAREHWADHCAVCHANDGSGDTMVGRRVYPPVPDMRADATQHLTDGELFYAIEQGIPWTAMPGWRTRTAEGEQESWALVRFIRHLPQVTEEELQEMERLNPKAPPNEQREQEIEDFLNGPPKNGHAEH
jgi:mono/diheme cytochrome c family protein